MRPGAASNREVARREALWLFGLALLLRLGVALLAASRFPPADDGSFYHTVALRIAQGLGYTWAWPDGAVTYAAHYPVGYPGLLGAAYALLGARPLTAMLVNALAGALLVAAVHRIALGVTSLGRARLAALLLALHPTLVLYTAALMTEALAASLLVLLAAGALLLHAEPRSPWWRLALGVGGSGLLLVRPQLLPLLPVLGAVGVWVPGDSSVRRALWARVRGAVSVALLALLVTLPWTLRNCQKMDGCVFVSANGGWNLLIGTMPEGKGSFAPITGPAVPVECREVFGEAGKDRCFGRAGARRIAEQPLGWLALGPQKLGQLFDHGAVASSYLHASNPALVPEKVKLGLAALETLYSRVLLLGACLALFRASKPAVGAGAPTNNGTAAGAPTNNGTAGRVVSLLAAGFSLSPWGYVAELGLLVALLSVRPTPGRRPLVFVAAAVLGLMCVTHVVFFGAARYALIWLPWLALLLILPRQNGPNSGAARVF